MLLAAVAILAVIFAAPHVLWNPVSRSTSIEVHPGEDIQAAMEDMAKRPIKGTIRVHRGIYRPRAVGHALIYFNARHDGTVVEAVGPVTLTAANPEAAVPSSRGYPALVNHVVGTNFR